MNDPDVPLLVFRLRLNDLVYVWRLFGVSPDEDWELRDGVAGCSVELLLVAEADALSEDGEEGEE